MKIFYKHKNKHDSGFTLPELTVAIVIISMALLLTGQLLFVLFSSDRVLSTQTRIIDESANPMEYITKNIMQAFAIENPTPYSVSFLIDPSQDGNMQRIVLDINGSRGTIAIHNTNSVLDNTTMVSSHTFTTNARNRDLNTPVFRYFSTDGKEITSMSEVPARATQISIQLITRGESEDSKQTVFVLLRNRPGN